MCNLKSFMNGLWKFTLSFQLIVLLMFSMLSVASFEVLKIICIWFPLWQLRSRCMSGDPVLRGNWRRQSNRIVQRLWIIQLLTTVTSLATILCANNRDSLDRFLFKLKNQESFWPFSSLCMNEKMWKKVFSFSHSPGWNSIIFASFSKQAYLFYNYNSSKFKNTP